MSNIDNLVRTVNEYIKDIYNIFGAKSKEYSRAFQQVQRTIPKAVLESSKTRGYTWQGDTPQQPLQLSRSKAFEPAYVDTIEKLRGLQRRAGTAKQQREIYRQVFGIRGIEYTKENIKSEAEKEKVMSDNIMDLYDDLMSSEYLTEDEKEIIHNLLVKDYFQNDELEKAYTEFKKYESIIEERKRKYNDELKKEKREPATVTEIGKGVENLDDLMGN